MNTFYLILCYFIVLYQMVYCRYDFLWILVSILLYSLRNNWSFSQCALCFGGNYFRQRYSIYLYINKLISIRSRRQLLLLRVNNTILYLFILWTYTAVRFFAFLCINFIQAFGTWTRSSMLLNFPVPFSREWKDHEDIYTHIAI